MFGSARVSGWDGTEREARPGFTEPKPEMRHFKMRDGTEARRIFDGDGQAVFVDDVVADGWWEQELPVLHREWSEERNALRRCMAAVDGVRNLLADGKLKSRVLLKGGHLGDIPVAVWRSERGGNSLRTGYVEFAAGDFVVWEGPVLVDRAELEKLLSDGKPQGDTTAGESAMSSDESSIDTTPHPYLAFMLRAAREIEFAEDRATPKKVIEGWLRDNWPTNPGEATNTKVTNMATFLRRPKDEAGGLHSLLPRKGQDH